MFPVQVTEKIKDGGNVISRFAVNAVGSAGGVVIQVVDFNEGFGGGYTLAYVTSASYSWSTVLCITNNVDIKGLRKGCLVDQTLPICCGLEVNPRAAHGCGSIHGSGAEGREKTLHVHATKTHANQVHLSLRRVGVYPVEKLGSNKRNARVAHSLFHVIQDTVEALARRWVGPCPSKHDNKRQVWLQGQGILSAAVFIMKGGEAQGKGASVGHVFLHHVNSVGMRHPCTGRHLQVSYSFSCIDLKRKHSCIAIALQIIPIKKPEAKGV
eukprot:CAMPEP_0184371774 /NCGR_PEP_ID=MMETSP1089-20130417/163585_1 /TAXON_ID=38269 ORGANISM="Gloeochaete wittrockiana, Strain SAG46.84" /NCGR_SAMPLE_ID=MMETSP1089 /ASSEMBLY_ACC=CAM_ASM_000445 /LENGTH=267 /DNA_ID=CAMNT_0026714565 /DNA_START=1039 /DNA_END=1842 /DNA_ORIENTATION=+